MTKNKLVIIFIIKLTSLSLIAQENNSLHYDLPEIKYGFGGGGSFGIGYSIFTGTLSEYVNNSASGNFGFIFSYDRFIYDIKLVVTNSDAYENYKHSKFHIPKDSTIQIFSFENTIGYSILDKKSFGLIPFAGVNVFNLSKPIENKSSGPDKIGFILGVCFDYKFSNTFGLTYMGDFIVGTRLSYNYINDYIDLNTSNINVSLYFRFWIRSYRDIK